MNKIKLFLGIIIGMIIVSCESNTYEEVSVKIENPTYVGKVKSIIDANCVSCHSPEWGQTPYLQTYDEVKAAIVYGVLIEKIEAPSGQGMPMDARMSQANIDAIKAWANGGFIYE